MTPTSVTSLPRSLVYRRRRFPHEQSAYLAGHPAYEMREKNPNTGSPIDRVFVYLDRAEDPHAVAIELTRRALAHATVVVLAK
ncbi:MULTISPECIES: hypothetical protein [unclassified Streptomyces]|uniref:hypothetical protein n=1 Tax=unclassified Streptomyces TaxID=2593676 RepID=UPI0022512421|nr:hypothetical protein [Streptomyces sp. NBC_00047]MCX5612598.1 hypothetical protein [Streptomyces sp. NBC_00047]